PPPAVLDRGREDVQYAGRFPLDVVEDGSPVEVILHPVEGLVPDRLEEGMAGRDPFEGWVFLEVLLVEDDARVFPAELAEAMLQRMTPLDQRARQFADAVGVTLITLLLGVDAGFRGGGDEEMLDRLGDEAAFLGLDGLADDRRQ